MLYPVSADALQRFRLMLDTPAHEGVERGRAAVQGGHGGPRRRADGDGGGARLGREPANVACVAAFEPADLRNRVTASWEREKEARTHDDVASLLRDQLPFQ